MEVMASGLPVIWGNIKGNTELIKNGEEGSLCISASALAYMSAIKKLLDDKDLQIAMGKKGRKTILRYDTAIIIKRTLQVYNEIGKEMDHMTNGFDE